MSTPDAPSSVESLKLEFDFFVLIEACTENTPESRDALLRSFGAATAKVPVHAAFQLVEGIVDAVPSALLSSARSMKDAALMLELTPYVKAWFIWAVAEANPSWAVDGDIWVVIVASDRLQRDQARAFIVSPSLHLPPPLSLADKADAEAVARVVAAVRESDALEADGEDEL